MRGSNRVEPLRKSENELKKRPPSVMAGAQNNKHKELRYRPKKMHKRGKMGLTLVEPIFSNLWTEFGSF